MVFASLIAVAAAAAAHLRRLLACLHARRRHERTQKPRTRKKRKIKGKTKKNQEPLASRHSLTA